ncbi:MAG: winged helix-turn-helix transcriptional regulator, partial [Chloracidobacterium sp.]|nr:winged helix-turn-helix transcriptional regulator [Chloracidobacterium sp.]
ILENVWPGGFDGSSNIVDVYVNYLRAKIDQGDERKLIQTVWGVGYVLRDKEGE